MTLHVGLGTFAPLHVESLDDVRLHFERYNVESAELAKIQAAERRIAVGTTSVRTLEIRYMLNKRGPGRRTYLFAQVFAFKAVDAMVTNFHLPQSSLLMLVSAFAGIELTRAVYRHAVRERYRFFSYGDCMLIL